MRSVPYPIYPSMPSMPPMGPQVAAMNPGRPPWQRNPHFGWYIAGGVFVLVAAAAVAGVYVLRRIPPRSDHGTLEYVSCDSSMGHRICIYRFAPGGQYAGSHVYTVDSGAHSSEFYRTPIEAAAAAKIFVALLAGEIVVEEKRNGQGQAA